MICKFCQACGKELVPTNPPRYDGATGEKLPQVCPSGECLHTGIWHSYGPWHGFWNAKRECRKCGDVDEYTDY